MTQMKEQKHSNGKVVRSDYLRKIVDIPLNIVPDLKKLAEKDNRDLKNWIEHQLITLAQASKTKK